MYCILSGWLQCIYFNQVNVTDNHAGGVASVIQVQTARSTFLGDRYTHHSVCRVWQRKAGAVDRRGVRRCCKERQQAERLPHELQETKVWRRHRRLGGAVRWRSMYDKMPGETVMPNRTHCKCLCADSRVMCMCAARMRVCKIGRPQRRPVQEAGNVLRPHSSAPAVGEVLLDQA
jgi:hypothetical protein